MPDEIVVDDEVIARLRARALAARGRRKSTIDVSAALMLALLDLVEEAP